MSFLRTAAPQVQTPTYTGVQIQTASSALPIPIVYGTNCVGPNIVWAANFTTTPTYSQSGGKGGLLSGGPQQTGYSYSAALVMGLCEGPINSLGSVFNGQTVTDPPTANIDFNPGTTPAEIWSYLSANFPSQALTYVGTAIAVSTNFNLGSGASIGSLSIEVSGLCYGSSTISTNDADPATVIADFLTNAQYGCGFPAASLDATSLFGSGNDASYQTYCRAQGLAFSPAINNAESANSILARWLQLTNATAVWSGGRLKIMPFGDQPASYKQQNGAMITYQPMTSTVGDLTDDDFIADTSTDPVRITRSDPYSAPNVVRLEALDRFNQYAATTVEVRDQASIERTGLRPGSAITAHEYCRLFMARTAAHLILQRGLYIRNTYAFKLSWDYCLLEPMDLVTLTDAGLGLNRTPVRLIEIAEGTDGLLSILAEEWPANIGTSQGLAIDSSVNTPLNRAVTPLPVN
jgi:hypothetical protein